MTTTALHTTELAPSWGVLSQTRGAGEPSVATARQLNGKCAI